MVEERFPWLKRGDALLPSFQAVPQIFSAGLDITEMCGKSEEHYAEFWRAVQEMWLTLYSSSMVTIAAVNVSSFDRHPAARKAFSSSGRPEPLPELRHAPMDRGLGSMTVSPPVLDLGAPPSSVPF